MEYRIEEREAFRAVGFAMKEPMTLEDCFEKVPGFWARTSGEIPRLVPLMDGSGPMGVLGISAYDGGRFSGYYIAAATRRPAPEDMEEYSVPAGTWAVFPCRGPLPTALQEVNTRIWNEWVPSCQAYRLAGNYNIEMYSPDLDYNEIWIPVEKI